MFQERSAAASEEQLLLKDENGPWLILAMTLSGDDAEEQSIALAKELRQSLGVPTFIHRKEFDHSQPLAQNTVRLSDGQRETAYTKKVRHAHASRDKMYAVLVGNYSSPDEPGVKRCSKRSRRLTQNA